MSDYIQVECPETGSKEVLQVEMSSGGEPQVVWCSRCLDRPSCRKGCLKQLNTMAFLMMADVPRFERAELESLGVDEAIERFDSLPVDRLPVVLEGRLVGSLSIRRLAGWKEGAQACRSLLMKEWGEVPAGATLADYMEPEPHTLSLDDEWNQAVDNLLANHRNEAFVVDHDGGFAGMVYARQLLRAGRCRTEP